MRFILLFSIIASSFAQTPTPTTTPMGSSMLTYSLSFPNSDPVLAMKPDRLAYLITAIACSANVPIELVFISYVRANGNYVAFTQAPHNTTGLVPNCANLAEPRLLRGLQVVATSNMLVVIYYLSPRAAHPTDLYFQKYASSITGTSSSGYIVNSNASGLSGTSSIVSVSTGGIVGIVIGVIAAATLAIGAFVLYSKRTQVQPPQKTKTHPPNSTKIKWMSAPIRPLV